MDKSLRTYNLPHDVIKLLRNKPNKSQFVATAVRKLANKENNEDVGLMDADTSAILNELRLRFEPHTTEMELLKTIISLLG